MSSISNANLLIAAQLYGGQAPASKARRDSGVAAEEFIVELSSREPKDKRPANPTLQAPGAPQPLQPAKRFDAGAGRKDQMPAPRSEPTAASKDQERPSRPGARLDIRV